MTLPTPAQLIGVPKFQDWMTGQEDAFLKLFEWWESPQRFCGLAAPTGTGKTLLALLLSKMTGARTCILTATKGLQFQYMADAEKLSGVLARGQNNFACNLVPGTTADQGPCHEGCPCEYRDNSCGYRIQLNAALNSNLVITNYAYWLAQTRFSSGLGDFGLLICTPGWTQVTLADGSTVPIGEIVDQQLSVDVLSADLASGELVQRPVTGWQRVPCTKRVLRISTDLGIVELTEDHSVWTSRGYIPAGRLSEGDIVYGHPTQQGATHTGEPLGRREYASWFNSQGAGVDVSPAASLSSLHQAEGVGGLEVPGHGRLGSECPQASTEWGMGRAELRVLEQVVGRTVPVLPAMLPRWQTHDIAGVARCGWGSGASLASHGQWPARAEQECVPVDALVWGGRQPSDVGLAPACLWYPEQHSGGQSRQGVLLDASGFWAGSNVRPDSAVHRPQYGIQGILCDPDGDLYGLWGRFQVCTERSLLFTGVPEHRAEASSAGLVSAKVRRVEEAPRPAYVYDITVEGTHNFFADGHLVRNCDEGHEVFGALENHLTVFLSRIDVEPLGITFPAADLEDWEMWVKWATGAIPKAADAVKARESDITGRRQAGMTVPGGLSHAYRTAKAIQARLTSMSTARGPWVIQRTHSGWRFTPRWVSPYGPELVQDVPKVLVMSAILTPKTADSIGIPGGTDRAWVDVPSYFPPQNTPIWHVPTVRVNYRTDDYGSTLWCSRIDQIIQRRLDRKGIVFTVSYDRANLLLSRSRFADIMVTHSTSDVVRAVERFKEMEPPAVLVSPSVTTGWDFPGDQCRFIIVGKLPYPDTKDPVMQARHADDDKWTSYLAMSTLVQECGRGSRSADDKCEVLVVDDNIQWAVRRYAEYLPKWFLARWRGSLRQVPMPLV